jgi:hypothetical protein
LVGKSFIPVTLSLAFAAAALAADPPAQSVNRPLICRGGERSLGSHIRRPQRCRTAEQWRQEEDDKGRAPISLRIVEGQNDGRQPSAPH